MPTSAPEPGSVSTSVADGVATLRFAHPKGNSLPGALLARLAREVDELAARAEARVIVVRSEGSGPFCAGASFEELQRIADPAAGKEFFMGFARLILAMRRCPKPIITRVHGKAVGGGVGVIAASDYAIAVNTAAARLSELAVGIGPFVVGPVIERKIGTGAFAAMAIDAGWRDAAWAERHGLYARLCGSVTELDEQVDALAATLARSNPDALAGIKQVVWQGTEGWDRLLEERAEMSGRLVLSDFTRQAIAAFGRG
ncbi:MAG TPA: enoyl-CoA hydratase/isomerase family protein [Gemmatimonadaceae bacterium]|nr:enoyl-CoA hydratase/isomerase family protein [Gemmatimonadaceae bacterium]